ncbi:MAG: PH domain-containing protein [Proteobacteria bacterium]|nr:PH domain-containing protein [Pseudomonadota bacterium]
MSVADQENWLHTSPLAAIFYLGKIYQNIAKNAIPALAPLFVLLLATEGDLTYRIVFALSVFVILTITGAFLQYWFFRYRIAENSVLIREGVFKKTQLDIKFDRIQAISTQQNIVFRAFGLVSVKLDTAGSAKQEGHLPAVKMSLADALKERIRQESRTNSSTREAASDADDQEHREGSARTLLKLNGADMLKIGLSSNRAWVFLVLLAPAIEYFDQKFGDSIDKQVILSAFEGAQAGVAGAIALGLIILLGFLLFIVIASIIGAFLSYHRFELVTDNDVLRSTGGLLTRHEHSVNLAKIQTVVASQGFMLRLFERFRLRANQASSGKSGSSKNLVVPLCEPDQLPVLCHEIFGAEFTDVVLEPTAAAFLPIDKHYVRSRIMLTGILPATAIAALMSIPLGLFALVFLLWIPLNTFGVLRLYKRYGVLATGDGFALRRGFIGYHVTAFLHRKVQRISVTQTLPQRRRGLATLRFYLASGSVKVPYVDFKKACELRDYILYRIESSELAWH